MRTTEQWLEESVLEFNRNKTEALENMLLTTTNVIEQYHNNPGRSTNNMLVVCLEHNKLFFKKLGLLIDQNLILTMYEHKK